MRTPLLSLSVRWVAFTIAASLPAQSRFADDGFPQLNPPEATKVLHDFRDSALVGDVCFRFEIIHRPRRGEASAPCKGVLWASSANAGTALRVELKDAGGKPTLAFVARKVGNRSSLWLARQGSVAQETNPDTLGSPLSDGLLLTPFDLQLPFTHWPETTYMSTERSRGRPVHLFSARNPLTSEPQSVTFAIDRAYGVLVQAVSKSGKGDTIRLLQLEEFAKVDEQWVLGSCSVRDEATRDTDLLKFTEAAIRISLPESTFDASTLTEPAPLPGGFKPL